MALRLAMFEPQTYYEIFEEEIDSFCNIMCADGHKRTYCPNTWYFPVTHYGLKTNSITLSIKKNPSLESYPKKVIEIANVLKPGKQPKHLKHYLGKIFEDTIYLLCKFYDEKDGLKRYPLVSSLIH